MAFWKKKKRQTTAKKKTNAASPKTKTIPKKNDARKEFAILYTVLRL